MSRSIVGLLTLLLCGATSPDLMAGDPAADPQPISRDLFDAVKKEDWGKARTLIAARRGLNYRDKDNKTPLLLVSSHGSDELVRLCIEAGADVKAADKDGWTPLMTAVACGHLNSVNQLLRASADPKPVNKFGQTALLLAAAFLRDDIVGALIAAGAEVNRGDTSGTTPLLYALTFGRDLMLDEGWEYDTRDGVIEPIRELKFDPTESDSLVLERAATLRALVEAGASLEARPKPGKTILELARVNAKQPRLVPLALLSGLAADPAQPAICKAVLDLSLEGVKTELEKPVPPDALTFAFDLSVGLGAVDLIHAIGAALPAARKAEVLRDSCSLAAFEGKIESYKALRGMGAVRRPQPAAIYSGSLDMLKLVLEPGDPPEIVGGLILAAAERGRGDFVQFLTGMAKDLELVSKTLDAPVGTLRAAALDALKTANFEVLASQTPFLVYGYVPEKFGWTTKGGERVWLFTLPVSDRQSQLVMHSTTPSRQLGRKVTEWKPVLLADIEKRLSGTTP